MVRSFLFLLGISAFSFSHAIGAEVGCYNDDSLDVISQDELRLPIWGGPARIPNPADCVNAPAVGITQEGDVIVDGRVVYRSRFDEAVEARVTPTGVVAIKTERGSLLVYEKASDNLWTWLEAHVRAVADFKLARNGGLIAVGTNGELIVDGRVEHSVDQVQKLYASASGRLVALMSDGSIVDQRGVVYDQQTDEAVKVKVAADGTVVWLTESGKVGSTKAARLYRGLDQAVSFKVSPRGQVAYVTQSGKLGRDGRELHAGFDMIVDYKIHGSGVVTARDSRGRTYYFD